MNDQHPALYSAFQWLVPGQFNIAQACLQRWSVNAVEGRRIAFQHYGPQGDESEWSYSRLADISNRIANGFVKMGVAKGDRVAVIMPLRPEAIAACLAVWAVGGIVVPLSPQLGVDGLALRLRDSQTRTIVADSTAAPELSRVMSECPSVRQLIGLEFQNDDTLAWHTLLARESPEYRPVPTLAEDPAILLYTAGTTGMPKGVLHAHRVLIGVLPAFVASQNWYPSARDLFWSPLDWTTAPGLLHGILAALYFGRPLLTTQVAAQGANALALLRNHPITHTVLLPSDLAHMQEAAVSGQAVDGVALRAVAVLGETLPRGLYNWATDALGIPPNELYGLTEAPGIIGHSHEKWSARPGSLGRPMPGHRLGLLDAKGRQCHFGSAGQLALNRFDHHGHPDPCLFLSYWRNEALTQVRYMGDWFLTGDMASVDEDGYFWFVGRSDDVFRAGGHRISPVEIEECLRQHPGVSNVAVVPKPEGSRGNAIKAFVVAKEGHADTPGFVQSLQAYVSERLAIWQIPREVEIVDRLPVTADGQIRRHVLRAREQQRSMLAAAAGSRPTKSR